MIPPSTLHPPILNMFLGQRDIRCGYMIFLTQRKSTLSFLFISVHFLPISMWIIFCVPTVPHSEQEINLSSLVLGC